MTTPAAVARIGISGWRYAPWRGVFFPTGMPQRKELEYAATKLDTVEINGSFYSLQRPSSYLRWKEAAPPGFEFAVKGGRYITHMLRLRNVELALANFFASGVLALDDKLGPVLWQLPERVQFDPEILDGFLSQLPHSTGTAAAMATGHGDKLKDRAWTDVDADRPLRHALEVRHPSFDDPGFYELLRRHNVALVIADSAGKWPQLDRVTSDIVYVRLHGGEELYVSGYGDEELDRWAETIRGWVSGTGCPDGKGRGVYVYFDNDVKVHAPFNAMDLARRLGQAAQ
ncbi:DUF72 domain-containing protein [Arthrobacter castelli]|uniref:DUF72 domain-containing protein n=1 Tax=Arthrobacter castelli TaxID=271431 RepID=UPI0003F79395|nr:DUF72 domain-containing protein [Arthrobacter castelli]